ncbi:MAG: hypothetical protein J6K12_05710 [Clostridia bacterium]|nr:hypothetical protein [Clostridia bacterium]
MSENKIQIKSMQLQDLLALILSKLYVVVIFAFLCGILMFVRVQYFTHDTYVSEGALVVSNITEDVLESKKYLTSSDMDSSLSLSASCTELLLRRGFFQKVSDDIGGKYSATQLKRMVSIASVNETEVLSVMTVAGTKEDAYLICSSIIENAPGWIESIYDLGVVKPADKAYMPDAPVSKNLVVKVMLGFFAGAVLGVLIILVANFFDDKIKRGSDISERYGIPLLGEFEQ